MILPQLSGIFNRTICSFRQLEIEVIRLRHPREWADLHAGEYLDGIDVKLARGETGDRVLRRYGIPATGEEVKDIVFELQFVFELLSPITIPGLNRASFRTAGSYLR